VREPAVLFYCQHVLGVGSLLGFRPSPVALDLGGAQRTVALLDAMLATAGLAPAAACEGVAAESPGGPGG